MAHIVLSLNSIKGSSLFLATAQLPTKSAASALSLLVVIITFMASSGLQLRQHSPVSDSHAVVILEISSTIGRSGILTT